MDDIYIYYIKLPKACNECVIPCFDGYTVYINEDLDFDGRYKAFIHALEHIRNNDFEKTDIQKIETSAHRRNTSNHT